MSTLKMTDEEKKRILEKHKEAIQKDNDKKNQFKKGLVKPEPKEEKK